jgi:hypothetical protein
VRGPVEDGCERRQLVDWADANRQSALRKLSGARRVNDRGREKGLGEVVAAGRQK